MLFIPEIIVYKIIEGIIFDLSEDFKKQKQEENTLLYQFFEGIKIDNFDWYKQAKEIILRHPSNRRAVVTHLFFNRDAANIPSIHITLPGESPGDLGSIGEGIGADIGFVDNENFTFNPNQSKSFKCTLNIVLTSDNTFEVLILYHAIKAMLTSRLPLLALSGFYNPGISGADLQLMDQMPQGVFCRAIALTFGYENSVPSVLLEKLMPKNIDFEGTSYIEEDDGVHKCL